MRVSDQHWLPMTPQKTWEMLNTPWVLQRCIKGCESVAQIDDCHFHLLFKLKVGPLKKRFNVQVEVVDEQSNQSYVLIANMDAGLAGKVSGETRVLLSVEDDQTLLTYDTQVALSGWFSEFGASVLEGAAKRYMGRFINEMIIVSEEMSC